MSDVSVEQVAEAMLDMIKEAHGKKKYKAIDLQKAMIKKFGDDNVDKKMCKAAIRQLVDSGTCTYSYVGGSYIVLPPDKDEQ